MKTVNQYLVGMIEASLTAFCFGLLGVFGKWAFDSGFTVGNLLSYRFLVASLVLWVVLLSFRRRLILQSPKQIFIFALLGIFGYGLMSVAYLYSIKGLSLTMASLILYTYPFWVSLFSCVFTKQRMTKQEFGSLVLAAFGLVLLLGGQIKVHEMNAAIAGIASAIIYALYIMVSGKLQNGVNPLVSSMYVITFGAVALLLYYQPPMNNVSAITSNHMMIIAGIAILSTVLPLTLELSALQKIKSTEFSLIMMLEPISAAIWGALIFNEKLEFQQIMGALIILAALILRLFKKEMLLKRYKVPST
ncbi:EamA family transporter [Peredibacter sp. HCB2-198]|uniref:EamA family transporter n=1 Tax=Peredibacter sp. HCB2-198 TaxID=3383025 RepID=UPI0038B67D96